MWRDATRSAFTMKRRGSVQGRADTGTGSGPGMERVITLTHIILHAGRIFWQWHHNCIICLVMEPALHVYKGQFSPWFGQFRYYHITGILIQWKFINSASLYCLNTRPPELECHKLLEFWYQSYVIIAYIINFQVQSTPGQLQIKFALYVFGLCLWINWVLKLNKVSWTTVSLALWDTGPRAQD